jgi:hypothetical protein
MTYKEDAGLQAQPDDELKGLVARLKGGEYDGVDIMMAWITIRQYISLRERYTRKGEHT